MSVTPEEAGRRLDHHLNDRMEESRSLLKKWISEGNVLVNDAAVKAGYRLRDGDRITVEKTAPEPSHLVPQPIPLQIVFEDESLVVIDKQAGLVVHPGAGNPSHTLVNGLLHHFETVSRSRSLRPGVVHRLDKGTSGLLVVAKNDAVHDQLAQQFRERRVDKLYLALVHGTRLDDRGRIESPIGRHPRWRTRMAIDGGGARAARTEFQVLERFCEFSLLQVKLHTGRTHQIRVHLESIGFPVVGDPVYGQGRDRQIEDIRVRRAIEGLGRQFLHSAELRFDHPVGGESVRFHSELPPDLAALLDLLK